MATPIFITLTLFGVCEDMGRIRKFLSDIEYELADGIHTYHQCPHCRTYRTRSGMCAKCLLERFLLERDNETQDQKNQEHLA
ncbi:MAG: hypothetical protein M0R34_00480 [Candidatus Marinimicrobia bacterium]|jgi:hypothetical protein|nr:hypothetical protein [Candidatus Neomarinimicrobiota bacterium]